MQERLQIPVPGHEDTLWLEITLLHHTKTRSITYNAQRLDAFDVPRWNELRDRLATSDFVAMQRAWWERHKGAFCSRAEMYTGSTAGGARYVTPEAADELREIVRRFYSDAVADGLPVESPIVGIVLGDADLPDCRAASESSYRRGYQHGMMRAIEAMRAGLSEHDLYGYVTGDLAQWRWQRGDERTLAPPQLPSTSTD